jgi:hypothetical protein
VPAGIGIGSFVGDHQGNQGRNESGLRLGRFHAAFVIHLDGRLAAALGAGQRRNRAALQGLSLDAFQRCRFRRQVEPQEIEPEPPAAMKPARLPRQHHRTVDVCAFRQDQLVIR